MTIEWPLKGDRPYLPTSKGWMLPDMGWARYVGNASYLYINGYRRAAELLQEEVLRRGSEKLVFPMLFMWRQHIELYVKYLIGLAQIVHDIEAKTPFGHRLPVLWSELRRLLELEDLSDEIRATFDATDQIMKDLEDVDPNSTHSRYAEGHTKDHQVTSLAKLPDSFDPQHFGNVVAKTSDFFSCVDSEYTNRLEWMAEALADSR